MNTEKTSVRRSTDKTTKQTTRSVYTRPKRLVEAKMNIQRRVSKSKKKPVQSMNFLAFSNEWTQSMTTRVARTKPSYRNIHNKQIKIFPGTKPQRNFMVLKFVILYGVVRQTQIKANI